MRGAKRKIVSFLLALTLIMIIVSLKEMHLLPWVPGFEAFYGAFGTTLFFLVTKGLSYITQREGTDD